MSLIDEIRVAWQAERPLDELLARFVVETKSRASGIWRLADDHLALAGFGWSADMPFEVAQGFQDATRRVSLEQLGLGIVKAAVTNMPAIGLRDASATGLGGSASWIEKFAATASLAVPINDNHLGRVMGVVAVSTAALIQTGDPLCETLRRLSQELGRSSESRS